MNHDERETLAKLDLDVLLQRLATEDENSDEIRQEVLVRTTPIIEQVIDRLFAKSGFAHEDLFRPGYLGLLNAVYNFDLSRGKPFQEYAENLIKGEIRHHIRDQVERVAIPAWMKDLNRQIENAEARLLRETGQLPTLAQLAETVNITEEGIGEIFKAREALSYVSLDAGQRVNDPTPRIDSGKIRGKHPVPFPN